MDFVHKFNFSGFIFRRPKNLKKQMYFQKKKLKNQINFQKKDFDSIKECQRRIAEKKAIDYIG